jgi:uncharacterized membrane protein YkgB
MRHQRISVEDHIQLEKLDDLYPQSEAFRSAPSTPDIPSSVGVMICLSYVMLMASFAVTMIGSRGTALALAICFFFLGMYLLVPAIFLSVEPKQQRRPSLDAFMTTGMQTYTGHMSGKDALAQILTVPILLTGAAIVMGIIAIKVV